MEKEINFEKKENQIPSNFEEILRRMKYYYDKKHPEYDILLSQYDKYSRGETDFDRQQKYSEWKDEDFKKLIQEIDKYFANNFHKM